MADKTSVTQLGVALTAANIFTSGSVDAGSLTVLFDEADSSANVIDMLEKAKAQIAAYYLKR